jgi:hypothetical protein
LGCAVTITASTPLAMPAAVIAAVLLQQADAVSLNR